MNRRELLKSVGIAATALAADRVIAQAPAPAQRPLIEEPLDAHPRVDGDLAWYDVQGWGVEGRGFADTDRYYDRLPARAHDVVRKEVWHLARQTAGMSVRFEADAPAIHVKLELTSAELGLTHMPATGASGLDLYGMHEGRWLWLATHFSKAVSEAKLLRDRLRPGKRTYLLHLPLYNGVKSLHVGVPRDATISPIAPRTDKPMLFYGTSILQGACASRPGLAFTHILGRRMDRRILNFGFSGNGRTELEVGRFLAELDPCIYIIDCLPNTSTKEVTQRTEPFVKLLRNAHPTTPILLVEDRTWTNGPLVPHLADLQIERRAAYRQAYDNLLAAGVTGLHYQHGDNLLGDDGEATVDGSHPNDLGMIRYADALEPVLRRVLNM